MTGKGTRHGRWLAGVWADGLGRGAVWGVLTEGRAAGGQGLMGTDGAWKGGGAGVEGRVRVVGIRGAYHGDTLGAMDAQVPLAWRPG